MTGTEVARGQENDTASLRHHGRRGGSGVAGDARPG